MKRYELFSQKDHLGQIIEWVIAPDGVATEETRSQAVAIFPVRHMNERGEVAQIAMKVMQYYNAVEKAKAEAIRNVKL